VTATGRVYALINCRGWVLGEQTHKYFWIAVIHSVVTESLVTTVLFSNLC